LEAVTEAVVECMVAAGDVVAATGAEARAGKAIMVPMATEMRAAVEVMSAATPVVVPAAVEAAAVEASVMENLVEPTAEVGAKVVGALE